MTQLTLTRIVCPECLEPTRKPTTIMAWLALFSRRHNTRKQLATLPDYLIRDLGLSPHDVRVEVTKPFWR